jgi:hypothetical protein
MHLKKYVKEILQSIAEGHNADLSFRATVFAHRIPRSKWDSLKAALPEDVRKHVK